MVKVSIHFVDGSLNEFSEKDSFLQKLNEFKQQGYDGKQLINRLITNDWAAPPLFVRITGTTDNKTKIKFQIQYN